MNSHPEKTSDMNLNPDQLKTFIINQLNRIYCVKAHLQERLPELIEHYDFQDLETPILKTLEDIGRQLARLEEIYVLSEEETPFSYSEELVEFIEDSFTAVYLDRADLQLRDFSILSYLSLIESIEVASLRVLLTAAANISDKQIKRLLLEYRDSLKVNNILFVEITSRYDVPINP